MSDDKPIRIRVMVSELTCPTCGAKELHPTRKDWCLIRAYKVDNYSQCLVCAGYYDFNLEVASSGYDQNKGWFI